MSVKKEAFSAVRWTTFATVGRVILQTLQLIILARLISPQDFGMMAMILSVTAFIQLFGDLGVSTTIIYSREISKEVLSTLYWLNLVMGALLSGFVWIASPSVARFYGTPGLEIPLSLAGSSFFLLAIGQQAKVLAEKRLAFRPIAMVELTSATISTVLAILVAYFGGGVYSLVVAVTALAAGNSLLYWLFVRDGWLPTLHFRFREALPNVKSGLYLLGASLANTATLQADVMIVGRMLGSATLGFYTVPRELSLKVMLATNPIVTRVGTPLIAKAQGDKALLCKIYLATIRMTSAINFPIYAAIAAFRNETVHIVLGPNWAQSADLLGLMAIWGMFRALGNPVGSLLYGTGHSRLALYQALAVTAIIIPTIYVGGLWGSTGVVIALTGFYILFVFAVWLFVVRRITGAGFLEYTLQWVVPLLVTVLSLGVALLASYRLPTDVARLAIGLPVGGIAYLAFSWLLNRQWCEAMLGMAGVTGRLKFVPAKS
ncbi:MOP flippase family protein [Rhizobium sp. B21/90]|uniref:MOP flippase family protein n=1 Tax=Rhizobium sp. B21/90 TaxID=2819993 RepID=UPI001C5A90F2|nr:MOP flippase family protein [Rhizobium sp. B21/90]QYA03909.1 MOP flippase family protein [Rhizobium sp. B21/90]